MRHSKRTGGFHAAHASVYGLLLCLMLLLVITIGLWLKIDQKLRSPAEKACRYACRSIASEAVAESITNTISQLDTASLTTAVYDANGTLTTLHAETAVINRVQALLLNSVNQSLQERSGSDFSVELGTLAEIHTLAGRGISIPMRFLPKGAAEVELESQFTPGSLNQIHHKIVANVTVHVGCSVPLYSAEETVTFQYLLSETVIMGEVPDYLGLPYGDS